MMKLILMTAVLVMVGCGGSEVRCNNFDGIPECGRVQYCYLGQEQGWYEASGRKFECDPNFVCDRAASEAADFCR